MKHVILTACVLSVAMFSCNDGAKKADETTKMDTSSTTTTSEVKPESTTPSTPVDSATMMKNWEAYMTPTEPHKMMASWDGTWEGEAQMWHMPNTPPEKTMVKSVNKMILGGRYQESVNTGNMMGMAFEGRGILGYDNLKKTFSSTWVDNMGTGTMTLEGPWDEATKSMTLTGTTIDPSSGTAKKCNIRQVYTFTDPTHQKIENYGPDASGKEFKMMEINLVKK